MKLSNRTKIIMKKYSKISIKIIHCKSIAYSSSMNINKKKYKYKYII